jgi:HK97 family phage portal protein
MQILGLTIARTKNLAPVNLMPPLSPRGGGWWPWRVLEPFTGAWQRNQEQTAQDVLMNSIVWACITLIASDFAKVWVNLVEHIDDISIPTENTAYSPVLRTPNHYQTRVKFFEYWMMSKLQHGNAYILKERNNRGGIEQGTVDALYVLDPSRVQVLVSTNGDVYYQLQTDYLSGLDDERVKVPVPASEIIHDIAVPAHHPLVGVSPLVAAWMAATQALNIQRNSSDLFGKGSILSGVLSSDQIIPPDVAARIQQHWEQEYAGAENIGKVAVLGGGLKFEPMVMTAVNAQLIEQLRWTAEQVCACFHVPGYKVGIGPPPPYTDVESVNMAYYQDALQNPIENAEELLEKGLELPKNLGVEFDIEALHRMNTSALVDAAVKEVRGGLATPNEGRALRNRKPVEGGNTIYLQTQDTSIAAIARRDATAFAPPAQSTPPTDPTTDNLSADALLQLSAVFLKDELAA